MKVVETRLPGVLLLMPDVFGDSRGFFMEAWNHRRYQEAGIPADFVQDNLSLSSRGVLRGLHFQNPELQGKLVSVLEGEVFDVAVDIRRGSPTFGSWVGEVLSSDNKRQLYVPEGFAHGFCVLSEQALFAYKCTRLYAREAECTIRWNDPDLGIEWPIQDPVLSSKDSKALFLRDMTPERLPCFESPALPTLRSEQTPPRHSAAPKRIKRPRILLVGSTGQVGAELRSSLQTLGEVVPTVEPALANRRGAIVLDLCSPDSIRRVVRDTQPDVIVNAAAYTAVDKAEQDHELAMAINGIAPGVLAEEAKRTQAALVHYSTDYVFDGSGSRPWREDDPTGPISVYGSTKLAGDVAIQSVDVPHLILRVSWVYAPGGSNFIKTMLRLGATRKELAVVDDQVGAPTSARSIADATAQILSQGVDDLTGFFNDRGGVVHCVCEGYTSWYRFAREIFRLAAERRAPLTLRSLRPIPTSDYPTPAARPLNSRMDCNLLEERFGLRLPHWKAALEQSFDGFVRESVLEQLQSEMSAAA